MTEAWKEAESSNASPADRQALWRQLKHIARGYRDERVRILLAEASALMKPDVSTAEGGWELLRGMEISWSRQQPGITDADSPGFRTAAVALGSILGIAPGSIDHASLRATDEQPSAFKVCVSGRWGGRETRTYAATLAAAWEAAEIDLERDPKQIHPSSIHVSVHYHASISGLESGTRIRTAPLIANAGDRLEDVRARAFERFVATGVLTGSVDDWVICSEVGNRLLNAHTVGRLADGKPSLTLLIRPKSDFESLDEVVFDFEAASPVKKLIVALYLAPDAKMEDVFREALKRAEVFKSAEALGVSSGPDAWEWVSESAIAFRWLYTWTWHELKEAVARNGREPPRRFTVRLKTGVGG